MFPCFPYCCLLKCSSAEMAAEGALTSLVFQCFVMGEQWQGRGQQAGSQALQGQPSPSVGAAQRQAGGQRLKQMGL